MRNILVLGGTRYLGLEFINILNEENIKLFVASRNKIPTHNFIHIDRKNQDDLDNLFKNIQFDVVIDFINFSLPEPSDVGISIINYMGQLVLQNSDKKKSTASF